jgi:hypothetical protein
VCSIFSTELYEDPDGLLPLSLKQLKHFNEWVHPSEVIDHAQFIGGKPDIAS